MKKILIEDHREVDAILRRLFAAFDKVDAEEVGRHVDFFWARLAMHIRAENTHLFPAVLRAFSERAGGVPPLESVEKSILSLDNDHNFFMRELGAAVRELFEMREDEAGEQAKKLAALREKIEALRRRLELHNRQEEENVYEWAETLGAAEITALNAKIQRELTNLPPRFQKAGSQI
jgi:hypothetical protein